MTELEREAFFCGLTMGVGFGVFIAYFINLSNRF